MQLGRRNLTNPCISLYSLLQRLQDSGGVYSCARGAGPRDARRPGWRRRRRRWVTAAARPPRGQCRPRAALRRPPRDRRRPPRSVAECYPVLNVTLTHSIPDTTALTSSIHAARAAIGRASRPGGAVLPLRPFITPGRRPRRRRGAGARGPRGVSAGGRSAGRPGASPAAQGLGSSARPGPGTGTGPGPHRQQLLCREPAPPRGARGHRAAGETGTGRRSQGAPTNAVSSPACRDRLPEQGVCEFLGKDVRNGAAWRARGVGEERLHRTRPPTRSSLSPGPPSTLRGSVF